MHITLAVAQVDHQLLLRIIWGLRGLAAAGRPHPTQVLLGEMVQQILAAVVALEAIMLWMTPVVAVGPV
mgnify:CR=1 FL=1